MNHYKVSTYNFLMILPMIIQGACGGNAGEQESDRAIKWKEYSFQLVQKLDSTSTLTFVTDFTVDKNGNIYAIDIGDFSLKKFNSAGRLVQQTGNEGSGPGEFRKSVYTLNLLGNRLALHNTQNISIELFKTDLEFDKSILTNGLISNIAVNGRGDLVVVNLFSGSERAIQLINEQGTVLRNIPGIQTPGKEVHALYNLVKFIVFRNDDSFYVAYPFRNLVQEISIEGGVLNTMTLPGIPGFSDKSDSGLPTNPIIQDLAIGPDNLVWVLARSYSENPAQNVYVFNAGGTYLHTFNLPEVSQQIEYRNGHVYALGKGGYAINKWALIKRGN